MTSIEIKAILALALALATAATVLTSPSPATTRSNPFADPRPLTRLAAIECRNFCEFP